MSECQECERLKQELATAVRLLTPVLPPQNSDGTVSMFMFDAMMTKWRIDRAAFLKKHKPTP